MPDNGSVEAVSTPGATFAWDDIGGVNHPRTKLSLGSDGVANDAVAGAGAVGVGVQRVTLASDDPAVVALQTMDDLVLAEDAAHASGDKGVQALSVRKDTPAALGGTDGDYQPLITDANGRLHTIEPSASGAATSLAVIDDWDESDRAKVNPIVGQAGVSAAAGAVDAGTQRVTLASNDPLVVSSQLIDDTIKADSAVFTPNSDKVQAMGAYAQDGEIPSTVSTGDVGIPAMTNARGLHVYPVDANGAAQSIGTSALAVESGGNLETAAISLATLDNIVLTEDAAHVSGDAGVMPLAVRKDTAAALAGADGDYHPLEVDSSGRLRVTGADTTQPISAASLPLPSGAATEATSASVAASLAIIDDWDETDRAKVNPIVGQAGVAAGAGAVDGATQRVTVASDAPMVKAEDAAHISGDSGIPALGVRRDADTTPVSADGDYHNLVMDNAGNLKVNVKAAVLPSDAATATAQATGNSSLSSIKTSVELIDDTVGASAAAIPAKGVAVIGTDGTNARVLKTDSSGELQVDVLTLPNVTLAAGTNTNEVVGDAAHDAAAAGNPVLIGARANANEPTAVSTDNDVTHLWADLLGRLVVLTGHPNPETPVSAVVTSSGDNDVIAAPGASLSLYICKGSIVNAGSANIVVGLQEESSATSVWSAELASEGGGALFDFGSRGWKLTANKKLQANLGAAGTVHVNVTEYYIAA